MDTQTKTTKQTRGANFFAAVQRFVKTKLSAFRRARQERVRINQLLAFNDNQLKDIGLYRSDIRAVVAGMTTLQAISMEREHAVEARLVRAYRPGSRDNDAPVAPAKQNRQTDIEKPAPARQAA